MRFISLQRILQLWPEIWNQKLFTGIVIVLAIFFFWNMSIAAPAENPRRYEVVTGTDDKAYLVDTATGFVWVLTYRTMATGREPIAIPYKFIQICPKNQRAFLVEDVKDGACLPPK